MKKHNQEILYSTLPDFVDVATKEIYTTILELLDKRETINIALSGGSTPIPILEKLKEETLDWKRISFFLVDERCVPLQSKESNFGTIKQAFFDFTSSTCYPMFDTLKTAKESAREYENIIRKIVPEGKLGIPVFDLMILGMGGDGHIASLFPDTLALQEDRKMVVHNEVAKLKNTRVSLTYPLIMAADHKIMLIKGEEKIKILNELLNSESTNYPVSKVFYDGAMKWVVGQE